jgi:hypothetical protein
MSTFTNNLNLEKPADTELYDIGVHNLNYDKMDDSFGVTFCTSATRPPAPRPRRMIFETDTQQSYAWDGDEWVQISTLTIAGVLMQTVVDAKGDLLIATAADTVSRLAVGANNTQLIADSSTTSGLRWSSNPPMRVVTLSDVASVPLDPTAGKLFKLTATGNRTIQAPAVGVDGMEIIIAHTASGGARTLALTQGSAGAFKLPGATTTLNSTATGETDYIRAIYSSTAARWHTSYIMEAM